MHDAVAAYPRSGPAHRGAGSPPPSAAKTLVLREIVRADAANERAHHRGERSPSGHPFTVCVCVRSRRYFQLTFWNHFAVNPSTGSLAPAWTEPVASPHACPAVAALFRCMVHEPSFVDGNAVTVLDPVKRR